MATTLFKGKQDGMCKSAVYVNSPIAVLSPFAFCKTSPVAVNFSAFAKPWQSKDGTTNEYNDSCVREMTKHKVLTQRYPAPKPGSAPAELMKDGPFYNEQFTSNDENAKVFGASSTMSTFGLPWTVVLQPGMYVSGAASLPAAGLPQFMTVFTGTALVITGTYASIGTTDIIAYASRHTTERSLRKLFDEHTLDMYELSPSDVLWLPEGHTACVLNDGTSLLGVNLVPFITPTAFSSVSVQVRQALFEEYSIALKRFLDVSHFKYLKAIGSTICPNVGSAPGSGAGSAASLGSDAV
jgi:hypothetical protein